MAHWQESEWLFERSPDDTIFVRNALNIQAMEGEMAGYGLVVLIFAVVTATAGYYWMRND